MKTRCFLIILSVLTFINTTTAQDQTLQNSLLWEVSGNGLKKSSYLYGTMHMVCEEDLAIRKEALKAIKNSKKIVFELDLTDLTGIQEFLLKNRMAEDSLSKGLSKEEKENLSKQLMAYNIELSTVELIKPFLIITLISAQLMPECTSKAVDMELLKYAQERDLPVGYFETTREQLEMANKAIDRETFIKYMNSNEDFSDEFNKLSTAYLNEDLNALREMTYGSAVASDQFIKYLLVERNQNWIEVMPNMMQEQSTFIAVGAAHLVGEDGLIDLLQKMGYTVEAILAKK